MLSRVAENLYWIGRYVERAESVARLLDVGFELELDASGVGDLKKGPVEGVLELLGCRDAFERSRSAEKRGRAEIPRFLGLDRRDPHSIVSMIARAREDARGTQEAIGAEAWGQINQLYLYLIGGRARRRFEISPPAYLRAVRKGCVLFDGLLETTLPRTEAYHFLRLGRHLERFGQICLLLIADADALEPENADRDEDPALSAVRRAHLLQSCSAHDGYLRLYQDKIEPECVVRYLVLDADFPRSMRFCVERCRESLREIGGAGDDPYVSEAERRLGRLEGELRYLDLSEIFERGLRRFLANALDAGNRIGDQIHQTYFSVEF